MTSGFKSAEARERIGAVVRQLRVDRNLTQKDMASVIGISQPRLSEIERGRYSLTAEQLLYILKLFNVDVSTFEPSSSRDRRLQNALARFGAQHLREYRDVIQDVTYNAADKLVVEVLLEPSSNRFVTALCPVLVWSIDDIFPAKIQSQLAAAGVPTRFPWLVDNTLIALQESEEPRDRQWRRCWRRAGAVLRALEYDPDSRSRTQRDILDSGIRSTRSVEQTWKNASETSRMWGVVSALMEEDFISALRRAADV